MLECSCNGCDKVIEVEEETYCKECSTAHVDFARYIRVLKSILKTSRHHTNMLDIKIRELEQKC